MYTLILVVVASVLLQDVISPSWQVILGFGGGVVGRIVVPYLLEWLKSEAKFDWKYLVGQLLAVIIALVPIVLVDSWMAELAGMTIIASVLLGWSSADMGREGQKVYDLIRAWLKK